MVSVVTRSWKSVHFFPHTSCVMWPSKVNERFPHCFYSDQEVTDMDRVCRYADDGYRFIEDAGGEIRKEMGDCCVASREMVSVSLWVFCCDWRKGAFEVG